MADHVPVPVILRNNEKWGQLYLLADHHIICGEVVRQMSDTSFENGHRVRRYSFKKSVNWKIPDGVQLDVADVAPANAPRRKLNR
jgi:hypothetical protein